MKTARTYYNDDGVMIPGILVKRFLRKPVFYADDPSCGWDRQIIRKADREKLRPMSPIDGYIYRGVPIQKSYFEGKVIWIVDGKSFLTLGEVKGYIDQIKE